MQAKQKVLGSPAVPGGLMGPWAKCSEKVVQNFLGRRWHHGPPNPSPALKLDMQAKQNFPSGDLCLGGRAVLWAGHIECPRERFCT
eukprot:1139603-Pelagomonas_calceolata.AAC.1